jgi:hypothetical protein
VVDELFDRGASVTIDGTLDHKSRDRSQIEVLM